MELGASEVLYCGPGVAGCLEGEWADPIDQRGALRTFDKWSNLGEATEDMVTARES